MPGAAASSLSKERGRGLADPRASRGGHLHPLLLPFVPGSQGPDAVPPGALPSRRRHREAGAQASAPEAGKALGLAGGLPEVTSFTAPGTSGRTPGALRALPGHGARRERGSGQGRDEAAWGRGPGSVCWEPGRLPPPCGRPGKGRRCQEPRQGHSRVRARAFVARECGFALTPQASGTTGDGSEDRGPGRPNGLRHPCPSSSAGAWERGSWGPCSNPEPPQRTAATCGGRAQSRRARGCPGGPRSPHARSCGPRSPAAAAPPPSPGRAARAARCRGFGAQRPRRPACGCARPERRERGLGFPSRSSRRPPGERRPRGSPRPAHGREKPRRPPQPRERFRQVAVPAQHPRELPGSGRRTQERRPRRPRGPGSRSAWDELTAELTAVTPSTARCSAVGRFRSKDELGSPPRVHPLPAHPACRRRCRAGASASSLAAPGARRPPGPGAGPLGEELLAGPS